MPDAPQGTPFGPYVLVSLLGKGGFGEVWKAWDTALSRWVALKLLRHDDPDEVKRFLREAQTSASLVHPNIAAIYAVGQHEGRPFIAMQLIDGQTLQTVPRTDKREMARVVKDAARAVAYAHGKGVVHRDLKPANMMVDRDGRVFVMDFGLAKQVNVKNSLSVSGMMVGTPAYMSPEQARGEKTDARSDVWSLGATLYELIADRPPFRADDLLQLLTHVVTDEPKPIAGDAGTIAMKCLEKSPTRRYADANALADELTRYLDGEPISARPASALYRVRTRIAKSKWVVLPAVAAVLLAIAVGVIAPRWLRESRKREEAEFYLPLERRLDVLRMGFYQPDLRLQQAYPQYERLIGEIEQQMKRTGECATGHYLIARCREVLAEGRAALNAYDRALQLAPDHGRALLGRGRFLLQRSLRERIKVSVIHKARARAEAREAAECVRRALAVPGAADPQERDLADAYLAVVEGRRFDAGACLARWRGEPFVEEFILLEGVAANTVEALDAATKRFAAAIPSYPLAHYWRAMILLQEREVDATIASADRAIEINPRYVAALTIRAWALAELNRLDAAEADIVAALEIEPDSIDVIAARAKLREKRGDLAGALVDYATAINDGPSPHLHGTRASVHIRKGDLDAGLADCEAALAEDPDHAGALINRAVVRRERDDAAGARSDLDRAIARDPKSEIAYASRAVVRADAGDVAGAIVDFERALEVAPAYWTERDRTKEYIRQLQRKKK